MKEDLYSITKGYGTGALPHPHDARDFQIERIPTVSSVTTIPQSIDYSQYVWSVYNQGSLPACVTYSESGMLSIFEYENERLKRTFDAARVYWELGGDGHNGVPTGASLRYAVDKGFPVLNTLNQRDPIASYAFTRDPMTMVNALAAGKLCVMAILLPTDFLNGDCFSMTMSTGYHQVCVVGYDLTKKRFKFLNSWGTWYGKNGFGTISFEYLTQQNNQNGYFYAYTVMDLIEGDSQPLPVKVITGYQDLFGNPITFVAVKGHFAIVGKGFGSTKGIVKFNGLQLGVYTWSDAAIETYYNLDLVKDTVGAIDVVTAAGDIVSGPLLTIKANIPIPTPTPVGRKITLHAAAQKLGGMNFVSVVARWADTDTPAAGVVLDMIVGTHKLTSQKSGAAGGAYWIFDITFIGLATITAHEIDKPVTGSTSFTIM